MAICLIKRECGDHQAGDFLRGAGASYNAGNSCTPVAARNGFTARTLP